MGGWVIGRLLLWVSVSHTVGCSGYLCGECQSARRWCHCVSEQLMGEKKVARDSLANERRGRILVVTAVAREGGKGLGEWWRSGLGAAGCDIWWWGDFLCWRYLTTSSPTERKPSVSVCVCVCVCVFGLCAHALWKMPPSAIHTSIEGANKGHTRTVSSLYVCVFFLCPHFDGAGRRVESLTCSSFLPPCTARPSKVALSERKKLNGDSAVSISFYFSVWWSGIDQEKAQVSILSALSVAKAPESVETGEVSSKKKQ